jgi:hypothetical protein
VSGVAAAVRVFAGRRGGLKEPKVCRQRAGGRDHPQALGLSGADIAKRQTCYGGSSGLGMHSLSIGSHRNHVREEKDR